MGILMSGGLAMEVINKKGARLFDSGTAYAETFSGTYVKMIERVLTPDNINAMRLFKVSMFRFNYKSNANGIWTYHKGSCFIEGETEVFYPEQSTDTMNTESASLHYLSKVMESGKNKNLYFRVYSRTSNTNYSAICRHLIAEGNEYIGGE